MSSIIQQLEDKGYTVITFAEKCGVSRSAIYQTIDGEGSRKIRVEIARTIQKSPIDIWGDTEKYLIDQGFYMMKILGN